MDRVPRVRTRKKANKRDVWCKARISACRGVFVFSRAAVFWHAFSGIFGQLDFNRMHRCVSVCVRCLLWLSVGKNSRLCKVRLQRAQSPRLARGLRTKVEACAGSVTRARIRELRGSGVFVWLETVFCTLVTGALIGSRKAFLSVSHACMR